MVRFGNGAPAYECDEPVIATGQDDPKTMFVTKPIADRARDRQGHRLLHATPDRTYCPRVGTPMAWIDDNDIWMLDITRVRDRCHCQ